MQQNGPATPYEVFCHECHVSFAAGTKRCVHCGSRLDKKRHRPKLDLPPGREEVVLEESGERRGGFSPFTLIWVVLLVAGYLYRSCTAGP